MSDLDQLREVGLLVRQPSFEELLETRRRRTLQTRVSVAAALAVAGIATVGALATTGNDNRTGPPPVAPSPTTTEATESAESFEIPAGQQTITPDIGPGDIHGFDELATVTNSQPEHQGDSELSVTVTSPVDGAHYSLYCRGGSDLFYIWDHGDGGGGYGRCSPDADTSLDPLDNIVGEADTPGGTEGGTESLTVRMWIARPSADLLGCLQSNSGDCGSLSDVPPVVNPDAEFGFQIYVHPDARPVLQLFEEAGNGEPNYFEALSSIKGDAWLVDRAVVATPDADRLAFELPASNTEYLVDVYHQDSPHFDRCFDQHQDELPDYATTDSRVYAAAIDKFCGVDLRLVIDGTTIAPDGVYPEKTGHFRELGAQLSPGVVHDVEVKVVRGDPRNVRYAVIVRVPTQMP